MKIRFKSGHIEQLRRTALGMHIPNEYGTLQQCNGEIARLSRLAYPILPEVVLENITFKIFSEGVCDMELQQHLKVFKTKSI